MLVLTRSKGETVEFFQKGDVIIRNGVRYVLDAPILVEVVDIRGAKIRLGIEALREIPIHRGEVANAMRREAAELAASSNAGGSDAGGNEAIETDGLRDSRRPTELTSQN